MYRGRRCLHTRNPSTSSTRRPVSPRPSACESSMPADGDCERRRGWECRRPSRY